MTRVTEGQIKPNWIGRTSNEDHLACDKDSYYHIRDQIGIFDFFMGFD